MFIALTPKQVLLKNLIENGKWGNIGYGGARGGAKSAAVREIALALTEKYPQMTVLIFRRLNHELEDNHIIPMFRNHPELRELFNKTEKTLYHDKNKTIPRIRFGYAEQESDIYTFQGKEFDIIFVDEATHCTQMMIEFLSTCVRSKIFGFIPKLVLTMNPGGVSHTFIKRIFIDKIYKDNEAIDNYIFIQAYLWDNVFWVLESLLHDGYSVKEYYNIWTENQRRDYTLNKSHYARRLSALPEQLKKAFIYGDWDVFAGMFFKEFNRDQIIKPFPIPEGWDLGASLDPGFSSPLSFGIQARDYEGKIYRVATYYNIAKIPDHVSSIANLLNPKNTTSRWYPLLQGRQPDWIVSGKDAFAKLDKNAIIANDFTLESLFRDAGLYLSPAITDRIQGWWTMRSLFPKNYMIFDEFNKPLIDQITSVQADDRIVEDIQGRGNDPEVDDHAIDEARYGVMRIFRPIEYKKSYMPKWYYEEFGEQDEDPQYPQLNYTAMGV